jgi:hypothetical protein
MNIMNHLCFLHKFNKYFLGVSPRHQHGRLSFIENPEIDKWWQIVMMIALKHMGLFFGLEVAMDFCELDNSKAMVGAIELNREEAILAFQALRRSVRVDDAL